MHHFDVNNKLRSREEALIHNFIQFLFGLEENGLLYIRLLIDLAISLSIGGGGGAISLEIEKPQQCLLKMSRRPPFATAENG